MDLRTALLVAAWVAMAPRSARAVGLGGACGATSDCDEGTWCVDNVCGDEEARKRGPTREPNRIAPWFKGPRGLLGVTLGGGPAAPSMVVAQLALRAGGIVNGIQLFVEVSPGTTVFGGPAGGFEVTANIGPLIPITRSLAWILRLGGGGGFLYGDGCCVTYYPVPQNHMPAFGLFRFDLLGMAIRASEHVVIEIIAPSFRLAAGGRLATSEFIGEWMATGTVEYVF